MYTCLSGFVDICESVEEAFKREAFEEAGDGDLGTKLSEVDAVHMLCISTSHILTHPHTSSHLVSFFFHPHTGHHRYHYRCHYRCHYRYHRRSDLFRGVESCEAGVRIHSVSLVASQPWPIGRAGSCELMLACKVWRHAWRMGETW